VTATLSITILANATAAKKAFAETSDSAEDLGKKTSGMGLAMKAGAATAAAALVKLGIDAYAAAEESARIGRETERVIRTTGASAWTSAAQVSALAGAISEKTGADDEAIQSGANLLLTFTRVQNAAGEGNDVFDQATQAALDMSTALGTDMSSSAVQLGKALNDPIKGITALTRSGVSFTEQQRAQISAMVESGDILGAQKVILGELQREFGGAAEAAGTPLDKLKTKVGNLQEAIGGALIPIVSTAATVIGDNMGPAIGKATQFLADHSEAVKFLATVGLAGLALAYGPVIAGQIAMVATNVVGYVTGVIGAVTYMGEAFLTVAAQQGVLTASTQALSYAFATMGPALVALAIGAALYALVSAMDTSSESAEKFWESMQKQVDLSSLESIRQTTGDVESHIKGLRRTIDQGSGFGDLAASAADLLIPFHDVENSLRDQQNEVTTLNQKQSEQAAKVTETSNALQAYADTQAGVNETNRTAAVYWDQNAQLMSDAELAASDINTQLHAIATSKKIELTSDDAVARVQALYEKTQFATTSTLGMSEAQEKYNDAASTAKDKTDAYKMSLDALTGAHLGAAQAETQYSQNSLTLMGKLNQNRAIAGGLIDANQASTLAQTAAVNENNSAIQGNAKAAIDLANAKYAETGSIDQATASLATNREALINTMVQTGYTREAAEAYINRLGLTPEAINTQVNLNNGAANMAIAGTQGQLDRVGAGAHAVVTADTSPADKALNEFWSRMPDFQGPVTPEMAMKWLKSHQRAAGGPVARGAPYVVGERGPELFVPGISGRIIPAHKTATGGTAAGGTGGTVNHFHLTFPHTGLGADSPAIQRDVVDAIRRYETRNGPVRRRTG
jgi:hypothetical protein